MPLPFAVLLQPFDAERQQLPLTSYCQKMYMDIIRITAPAPLPLTLDLNLMATAADEAPIPLWATAQQQAIADDGIPCEAASVADTE